MDSLWKFRYLGRAFLKVAKSNTRQSLISTRHFKNSRSPCYFSKNNTGCSDFTNHVRNYAKSHGKSKGGGKQKVVHLSDEEISQVIHIEEYRSLLLQAQEKLKKDFIDFLSLRPAASNIDNLIVKIEDEEYPLHELAQISKKNPNLIAINMTDFPEALKPTIQAIIDSGGDMNPQQEGTMIYLSVPKVTREHREKLSKNAKVLFSKAKDGIREIQNSFVREAKKQTDLSEDLVHSATHQAFIACSWGVDRVGLVTLCFGVCGAAMALAVGPLVKQISQRSVIILAACANLAMCVVLFFWKPSPDFTPAYFIVAGAWGMGDSIWWSQVPALYGLMFPNDREAAFSNLYFWSFLGFFMTYSYANHITIVVKLGIFVFFLVTGLIGYLTGQHILKSASTTEYAEVPKKE